MAYKRTGNPSGRPRADRELPLISVDALAGTQQFNAPLWWFVMAEREADLKFVGKWKRGSLQELAGHFVAELSDKVKSPAAVTKVRLDHRYQRQVAVRLRALEMQAQQDALDPEATATDVADRRADILAAICTVQGDPN